MTSTYDLHFYFDPVCPFAWLTSKWVRTVAQQRNYRVDWRFISLRILNAEVDYATHFPSYYEEGHTAGLKLLRVAAKVRTLVPHGGRRRSFRRRWRPPLLWLCCGARATHLLSMQVKSLPPSPGQEYDVHGEAWAAVLQGCLPELSQLSLFCKSICS